MLKIIADENIPYVKDAFSTLGEVITLPGRSIKAADLKFCDLLLVRSVTQVKQNLLAGTAIRFIASATSGTNHIDQAYLKQQDIGFAHALGSNANSVAEYVLSAIAHWSLLQNKPLTELSIGIIGGGQVGSRVKKLCHHIGVQTVVNDPPLAALPTQTIYTDLVTALSCDIVTLHVPLTTSGQHPTKNLINQQHIQRLKPGTLLINTSRGEVIDESALLSRQNQFNDLKLVLDVWQGEPKINLQLLANTLIGTPHIAGYSLDGKIRGTEMIYQACCKFLNKQPQWSASCIENVADEVTVNIHQNKQDIRATILQAYDINEDDKRLKYILQNQETPIDLYFDRLRKNYPIRREWSSSVR